MLLLSQRQAGEDWKSYNKVTLFSRPFSRNTASPLSPTTLPLVY